MKQNTHETEQAAKCELAETVLRTFGTLRLRVTGCSMLPSVWPGDILLIERQAAHEIVPGTIVLFAREGRLIAHRVVSITGGPENPVVVTQGDSLPSADRPVSASELLGRIALIFRRGEWIEPRARPSFSDRLAATFLSHSNLAARVLLRLRAIRQFRGKMELPCEN